MLNFSNPSRNYDEAGRGVRFWGYDRTFEISFFVEEDALTSISPGTMTTEAGLLETFDENLERIREVAGTIYARRRKGAYIYAYTLTKSDC